MNFLIIEIEHRVGDTLQPTGVLFTFVEEAPIGRECISELKLFIPNTDPRVGAWKKAFFEQKKFSVSVEMV